MEQFGAYRSPLRLPPSTPFVQPTPYAPTSLSSPFSGPVRPYGSDTPSDGAVAGLIASRTAELEELKKVSCELKMCDCERVSTGASPPVRGRAIEAGPPAPG
jgi:hypothetical protein